jgi:arsenical pump membrane protein
VSWLIAAIALLLILIRPWQIAEAVWACSGAILLVVLRVLSPADALAAVERGTDVYLFLTGMMMLAELGRRQGFFDWIAAEAVHLARGSRKRLFTIVYAAGTLVTIFLSNDATAVVLTPAVLVAVKKARATPLPYMLICALIANAASFVLPISNPANLVVYGSKMPPLLVWLRSFGLPSLLAIAATFLALRLATRGYMNGEMETRVERPHLSRTGKYAAWGIGTTAVVLILASAFDLNLGLPAFVAALGVAAVVAFEDREAPLAILKQISWSVLPLVAGLFVLVEAVNQAGALEFSRHLLKRAASANPLAGGLSSAFGVAGLSNVVNNLPVGLIAGNALRGGKMPEFIRNAVLIGVDLGPNLAVSGSLATILWLTALRREGEDVGFFQFLRFGLLVMPPALALSVLSLLLFSQG